jgi:hypothetical protein
LTSFKERELNSTRWCKTCRRRERWSKLTNLSTTVSTNLTRTIASFTCGPSSSSKSREMDEAKADLKAIMLDKKQLYAKYVKEVHMPEVDR